MKKIALLITLLLLTACASFTLKSNNEIKTSLEAGYNQPNQAPGQTANTYTIAAWNPQIFGDTKASNREWMFQAKRILEKYDIIFIQEIRDADGSAFYDLCQTFLGRGCKSSSRAGSTDSKEQYGIIYKPEIQVTDFKDYNTEEYQSKFERPPLMVAFNIDGEAIKTFIIHVDPDKAKTEIPALEELAKNEDGAVIVLGDLNADCNYYNHAANNDFSSWHWTISDDKDTTSKDTDCAYDRIILNKEAEKKWIESGVWTDGISPEISDHYLVWATFRKGESTFINQPTPPVAITETQPEIILEELATENVTENVT